MAAGVLSALSLRGAHLDRAATWQELTDFDFFIILIFVPPSSAATA